MKNEKEQAARIHLAFRFHVNFYHSYRGDSLDEQGIGKDIRIIRGILDDLDRLNQEGLEVRGTWDIENYYSLETMMRHHSPDLIERIRERVKDGRDEVELMSYNNGLVSACTCEEFEEQLSLSFHNEGGSGLDDLFTSWARVLRPQECMYTPSFLERYPKGGIPAISLFYSAVPFNGFGSFVPPMEVEKRYNPLELRADGFDGRMILLPAYNHGDIADRWISLKWWVKSIRREQLNADKPKDFLLLIDMDADDQFWAGMEIPLVSVAVPSFDGFYRLVRSVASIPWITFTSPGDYLKDHPPVGVVTINQDTADGSFDGYSSWAEKWDNTALWSMVQQSRDTAEYAERILEMEGKKGEEIRHLLDTCLRERLLSMSTTHFGMASPVMNVKRLSDGFDHAKAAGEAGQKALSLALASSVKTPGSHEGGRRNIRYLLPRQASFPGVEGVIRVKNGTLLPVKIKDGDGVAEPLSMEQPGPSGATSNVINLLVETQKDRIIFQEGEIGWELKLPVIRYGEKIFASRVEDLRHGEGVSGGKTLFLRGSLLFGGSTKGMWELRVTYGFSQGGAFLDFAYEYPLTSDFGYDKKKAKRLDRAWDTRWREVIPLEICPIFTASLKEPFRIIKHNFFGDLSAYDLDYGQFSKNRNLDSFNNHITNGWVAVSNRSEGILVAQHTGLDNSFAFCPMRLKEVSNWQRIRLNPFGTYYGKQLCYPTAVTGLGRRMAILAGNQFDSYAPSFNGKKGSFALMISGFSGAIPPEELQKRALLFSAAPLELN